jgi:hypothetical protein
MLIDVIPYKEVVRLVTTTSKHQAQIGPTLHGTSESVEQFTHRIAAAV